MLCGVYSFVNMTCLLLPASNKESEENEILLSHFPHMGMHRGLIKTGKKTCDFYSWYFPAVLCSLRVVLTCWNMEDSKGLVRFPSPRLASLLISAIES